MKWVCESAVFVEDMLPGAAARLGHDVVAWEDAWMDSPDRAPSLDGPVVFHGSLGVAAELKRTFSWRPGAFCDVDAFTCSRWYPKARRWLLHESWRLTTVRGLVESPPGTDVFVRPDSPLKPFSGRVVPQGRMSLLALDHGYYYDDVDLPVIVAPVRQVSREWRYVVVDREVVAGSAYLADGRKALPDSPEGGAWRFARDVAAEMPPPEIVYVLDVGEVGGQLRLIELNPFSGADLYACDADAVVRGVAKALEANEEPGA